MRPGQVRFVTACQQLLALAVVLAVLAPTASVLDLDIVGDGGARERVPGTSRSGERPLAAVPTAQVETAPVAPEVSEYALTAPGGGAAPDGRVVGEATLPRVRATTGGDEAVTGRPEPVDGFGTVGVTWAQAEQVSDEDLALEVRTRDEAGAWGDWSELEYHDQHAPDPGSREAGLARPGTDPLVIGDVRQVQVRAAGDVPADMRLSVVEPGESAGTELEQPDIDTGALEGGDGTGDGTGTEPAEEGDAALQAGSYTPKPQIFSRAQWGADERMRDPRSLHYYEVHAGFVHHTVNANDYSRAEVPGIIRSIYAYHTRSKGWSDVGYNFLVDRFGRIWEGRYGGVDRPVVGAHTLGYNDYSFAMSAIGNFETTKPSQVMLKAYGALFAWKLSLHGVNAASTSQRVGRSTFKAINGHRDAGSTACPGRYLYARIPTIRSMAAAAQKDFSGRERETDLVGSPHPDVPLRRASDKQVMLLPTGGLSWFARPKAGASGWKGLTPAPSPDLDGDGKNDVVSLGSDGARLWTGNGWGKFQRGRAIGVLAGADLVTGVGDLDGDGDNDMVGRRDGAAFAFLGNGSGGFVPRSLGTSWASYRLLTGVGDLDGDGHPDLVAKDAGGHLQLLRGTGSAGFTAQEKIRWNGSKYNALGGFGDYNADGDNDLFVRASNGAGYIFTGRGDGTFRRPFGPVWNVARIAGLSGGGHVAGTPAPDVLGVVGDDLMVVRNTGRYDATEPVATGLFLPQANLLLNAGDFDRDGHGDLISRDRPSGRLLLHRGDGRGHFGDGTVIGSGFNRVAMLTAVGDTTGDGFPDLMGQPGGGDMRIYPGRGASSLGSDFTAHSRISGWRQVGFGRWDADGAPDNLIRQKGRLLLFRGNGPGGLTDPDTLGLRVAPYDWFIGLGDTELRRHPDIAVRQRSNGVLWLVRTNKNGFTERRFLAEGMKQYDLFGG